MTKTATRKRVVLIDEVCLVRYSKPEERPGR